MGWPLTLLAGLMTYAAIKAAQRAISGAGDAADCAGGAAVHVEADTGLD
jgi:hypothetical protein